MGFNLIITRLASISSKMFCMRIASGSTSPPMAADIDGRTIKDCSVVTNVRVFSLLRLGVSLILNDDQDKEKEENSNIKKFVYRMSRGPGSFDLTTLKMSLV